MRASQLSAVDAEPIASDVLTSSDGERADSPLAGVHGVAAHGAIGMIRKSSREDRRKRSSAYDHTEPYKVVVDQSGVEFDVRSCRYCNAVFSFKGGTTSAALRHLKSMHPQEFFEGPASVAGDTAASASPVDAEIAVGTGHVADDQELQSGLESVDALAPVKLPETSSTTHKRRRYDDGYESDKPVRLTANQQAITHFLAHFKPLVDARMRLVFVKHLTYNDREAEMYNVLDDETRLEFVTQFVHEQSPGEARTGV